MTSHLLISSLIGIIILSGCTPKTPVPAEPQAPLEQSDMQLDNAESANQPLLESTSIPLGTVPPTLDKATQTDLKQMDDMIESIDSDNYSTTTLNDLQ